MVIYVQLGSNRVQPALMFPTRYFNISPLFLFIIFLLWWLFFIIDQHLKKISLLKTILHFPLAQNFLKLVHPQKKNHSSQFSFLMVQLFQKKLILLFTFPWGFYVKLIPVVRRGGHLGSPITNVAQLKWILKMASKQKFLFKCFSGF